MNWDNRNKRNLVLISKRKKFYKSFDRLIFSILDNFGIGYKYNYIIRFKLKLITIPQFKIGI